MASEMICGKCGCEGMIEKCPLEKHELDEDSGYEIVECYQCHTFYKRYWKCYKVVEMHELEL